MKEFDAAWENLEERITLVPGKQVFAAMNNHLQSEYKVTISPIYVSSRLNADEIFPEIINLIDKIEAFRKTNP